LSEFERCLSSGRIQRVDAGMEWVQKELEQASYDIARARSSLKRRDYKWAIVQGYYSMFHCTKALVLRAGYREKSHVCLMSRSSAFTSPRGGWMRSMPTISSRRWA
jgi:hypothetical protein